MFANATSAPTTAALVFACSEVDFTIKEWSHPRFGSFFVICFALFSLMPNGAKNWCVTLNNYTVDDLNRFGELCDDRGQCRYAVVAREVGESGTHHLQCFFSFVKRRTLLSVKALLGDRIHAEIARGSPAQAASYCRKDGDFEEFGEVPVGRGYRSDLGTVIGRVQEGADWKKLLQTDPVILARYPRFVDRLLLSYGQQRSWITETTVYWGETGTGKTRKAFSEASDAYIHSGSHWFDGYAGESSVIFDDFGGSEFKLTYLLKLLDRYPMRVPVKGGFVNWCPRKVWITSNYSPKEWFPNAKDEHVKAMFRRFSRVVRFRRLASAIGPGDDSFEEEVCLP